MIARIFLFNKQFFYNKLVNNIFNHDLPVK